MVHRAGTRPGSERFGSVMKAALLAFLLAAAVAGCSDIPRDTEGSLDRIRETALGADHDPPGTIVLVDGMSMQRPELADLWDVTIYLSVTEDVAIQRVRIRDRHIYNDDQLGALEHRYRVRYFPALRLYVERDDPVTRADVLNDMHDVDKPVVVRWDGF